MSQEDSRGLGKTIDFMRAVSLLFLVMNIYYFCYPFFHHLGCTNGIADKILVNLQRDTGLFTHSLVTKSFCLMFLFSPRWEPGDADRWRCPGGVSAVS